MRMYARFPQGMLLYTDVVDLIPTMDWQARTLAQQTWEPETFAVLDRLLDDRTVMLDIGAWIGVLTVFSARRAHYVIAFEPDPHAFAVLTANIALNTCANVKCLPLAIGDRNDSVLLTGSTLDRRLGCSTSQVHDHREGITGGVQVMSVSLDYAIEQLQLDKRDRLLIKMDIEGGEFVAIPASASVWRRQPMPTLLLSLHGQLASNRDMPQRVFDHLASYYGYGMARRVAWDTIAGELRLLPVTDCIPGDCRDCLLFAPSADLERLVQSS